MQFFERNFLKRSRSTMGISVIIPVHNAAKTLHRTLASLMLQTRRADDIVIVNDRSSDDFLGILAPYGDRITLHESPRSGAGAARNVGVAKTRGELLFFCDADLELAPDLLARLFEALIRDPQAAFAYCAFRWNEKIFAERPFDAASVRRNNYISTMSLVRRSVFPLFDESLARFQDWDVWLSIIERGGYGVWVPDVLFSVLEEGSMSRRGGWSRLRATRAIRSKHHLAWAWTDYWLAIKESLRVIWNKKKTSPS